MDLYFEIGEGHRTGKDGDRDMNDATKTRMIDDLAARTARDAMLAVGKKVRTAWRCSKCGAGGEIEHLETLAAEFVVELAYLHHWKSAARGCRWSEDDVYLRRITGAAGMARRIG
jgi:hypothetical protein